MEQSLFEEILVLYLIRYIPSYRDSYSLTKIISRKFGIIHFSEVSNSLHDKGFVTRVNDSGIYRYAITDNGLLILNKHSEELIKNLLDDYVKNDEEFIKALISRSSTS